MNSNNVKTTPTNQVDYNVLLKNTWRTKDVPTEHIIDNACLLLGVLTQNCDADTWSVDLRMLKIRRELNERTDVQLEDLDKLSDCLKVLKSSRVFESGVSIRNLDQWIKDKHFTISKQRGFEYVEDHYGDCNSNNAQGTIQKEITVSSNNDDLEEFEVIERSAKAVGEIVSADEDFVLL